ncbi:MAG: hypothetical protein B7Y03_02405 [Polaromonas sp. 24-62-144]|jgi:hypothetical protein|nr:MAG: hypothetical protein B7Y03_02405 [Polaromonas sp. 24-62-144]
MTPLQAIAAIAINLLSSSSNKLTLKTVQAWIDDHSDRDRFGTGYSGNRLFKGPSNGYIELTKTAKSGGFEIRASVFLDPRQGAAESKSWHASKLDAPLEKYFGRDKRIRVKI